MLVVEIQNPLERALRLATPYLLQYPEYRRDVFQRIMRVDAANGLLSLRPGTNAAVHSGAKIPNLSDVQGGNFAGSAPDLGALER